MSAPSSSPSRPAQQVATPGPWTAEPGATKGAWIKGANGEWAALACGDTDAAALANAHLIAAAPAMRDALDALVFVAEANFSEADDIARAALAAARSALALAHGAVPDGGANPEEKP